jgi:hypothetical protein
MATVEEMATVTVTVEEMATVTETEESEMVKVVEERETEEGEEHN